MFFFSLTPRKEPKEGCYPQGPLHRGMQTEDCRNSQSSVGFSNAGRRVELFGGLIKDAMTQDERWMVRYEEVVSFIETNHRNPSKHRVEEHQMLNWVKQQRKLMNAGALKPERVETFRKLLELIEECKRVNQYQ